MSGAQGEAAQAAYTQQHQLSEQSYGLGSSALQGGLSYLTNAYGSGGYDQSGKYGAMQSMTMDQTAGGNASARAQALSGVTAQKVTSGLDEMSKLRSMMSGQGLQTTGLAEQAGQQSSSALRGMYQGNQTVNTVEGIGALGAGIYGAGKQGGWWGSAAGQSAAVGGGNPMTGKTA
jgi:hypothetical protein